MVVAQGIQTGLRPGDHQIHLKAAGRKFCSSVLGNRDTPRRGEQLQSRPAPSVPFKEEQDKRQRGFLTSKTINDPPGIKSRSLGNEIRS